MVLDTHPTQPNPSTQYMVQREHISQANLSCLHCKGREGCGMVQAVTEEKWEQP